jgi:hypothetical protein
LRADDLKLRAAELAPDPVVNLPPLYDLAAHVITL